LEFDEIKREGGRFDRQAGEAMMEIAGSIFALTPIFA
jgi:hypothetical protein